MGEPSEEETRSCHFFQAKINTRRRVLHFADEASLPLVSATWLRPSTSVNEIRQLHYNSQDYERFRKQADLDQRQTSLDQMIEATMSIISASKRGFDDSEKRAAIQCRSGND